MASHSNQEAHSLNKASLTNLSPLFNQAEMFNTLRILRQQLNDTEDDPEFADREKESQEDDSDENGNMITGLISAFLGGLSKVSYYICMLVGAVGFCHCICESFYIK